MDDRIIEHIVSISKSTQEKSKFALHLFTLQYAGNQLATFHF
jgi:hypothetical protein